jgi:hypothetical protein
MPTIRLERLAIRTMALGLLGFDHLQLVYDPYGFGQHLQDHWHVVEGVRDPSPRGPLLGVQGAESEVTLARANTARGRDLEARIGTPGQRRYRVVAEGPAAEALWPRLTSHAADLAAEAWPYVAFAAPGSSMPTVNSSSLIASILHGTGVDITSSLPSGAPFMPGLETLLGTAASETLSATAQHTTLLGGRGDDRLVGASSATAPNKLYGGSGDDICVWSPAVTVCHGGQPRLAAAEDGTDTLHFAGAAQALVGVASTPPSADMAAGVTVAVGPGRTRIHSVERLLWSHRSDRVAVAPAAFGGQQPLTLDLAGEAAHGPGDLLDLTRLTGGVTVTPRAGGFSVAPGGPGPVRSLLALSVETLHATPASDHLRLDPGLRAVEAGGGDDLVLVPPDAGPLRLDVGGGADTLVLELPAGPRLSAVGFDVTGGGFDDRLVLVPASDDCSDDDPAQTTHVAFERHGTLLTLAIGQQAGKPAIHLRLHDFVDGHWGLHPGRAINGMRVAVSEPDCHRSQRRVRGGIAAEMMSNHQVPIGMRSDGVDVAECESAGAGAVDARHACRAPRAVARGPASAPFRRTLHLADGRHPRGRRHRRRRNHRSRRRHPGALGRHPRPGAARLCRPARRLAADDGRPRRPRRPAGRTQR